MNYQAYFGPFVHPAKQLKHFWRVEFVADMVEIRILAHGQNPLVDPSSAQENIYFPHFGIKCHTQKICFPTLKFIRTKVLRIPSVWSTNFFTRPCGSRRGAKKFVTRSMLQPWKSSFRTVRESIHQCFHVDRRYSSFHYYFTIMFATFLVPWYVMIFQN